jgi:hypothetical protein
MTGTWCVGRWWLGAVVVAAAAPSWAADEYKATLEYEALARDYKITKAFEEDADGDILKEAYVAFKDRQDDATTGGGVLVLKMRSGALRPWACIYLETGYPADLTVAAGGKEWSLSVARGDRAPDDVKPLTLVVGKDVPVRGEPGDPFLGMKILASSTARSENVDVKYLYDQDVNTGWAEGASGTGIGESLTFEFKKAVGLGLVAMFSGKGTNPRDFRDYNRVHRAVLDISTQSNLGDTSANLDFADLGITSAGNKLDVTFPNRPEFKFIKVAEPEVLKAVFRIDSVYLGDRKDDTHVSEVFFCPLLSDAELDARYRKGKGKPADPKALP